MRMYYSEEEIGFYARSHATRSFKGQDGGVVSTSQKPVHGPFQGRGEKTSFHDVEFHCLLSLQTLKNKVCKLETDLYPEKASSSFKIYCCAIHAHIEGRHCAMGHAAAAVITLQVSGVVSTSSRT